MISMVAHECGKPVLFVCPSYRFVTEVRIDALAKNEMIKPIPTQSNIQLPDDIQYMSIQSISLGEKNNEKIQQLWLTKMLLKIQV